MKYLYLWITILFCVFNFRIAAQYNAGAKQISLANSDVALSDDVFSIFNNSAGLAQIQWREVGIYYSPAPFGLSELANGFVAYNEPLGFGSVAIGGMTYGFELYRETKLLLAYSHSFNNRFFSGAVINYHTFSISNYGSTAVIYFNLGGLVYITDQFNWGFSVSNINRATISNEQDQIPTIFNTGFTYNFQEYLKFNTALEKDILYSPSVKFGIDYDIIEYLSLRFGSSNSPSRFTAGLGINYSTFHLDYAVFTHPDLGLTHQVGLIISFKE